MTGHSDGLISGPPRLPVFSPSFLPLLSSWWLCPHSKPLLTSQHHPSPDDHTWDTATEGHSWTKLQSLGVSDQDSLSPPSSPLWLVRPASRQDTPDSVRERGMRAWEQWGRWRDETWDGHMPFPQVPDSFMLMRDSVPTATAMSEEALKLSKGVNK